MIHQIDIYGKDKVETAIGRFQDFSKIFKRDEGFFLAFSGGKDSVVIKALADMAGVKYDAHYQLTSVDPPELVRFIKDEYPDVIIDKPRYNDGTHKTMWNLIPKKQMPPTMLVRYCCKELKESGGDGRLTVTGVRWAESVRRKNNQGLVTIMKRKKENDELLESGNFAETGKHGVVLINDNRDSRDMIEQCFTRQKTLLNPIIDWTDDEVWEFIREYKIPYCKLYDEGYKRLGCIGCPMNKNRKQELEKYPKYKAAYIRAFQKMLDNRKKPDSAWKTAEDVYKWWIREGANDEQQAE